MRNNKDLGASADADRATRQSPSPSVSALRASIPSADAVQRVARAIWTAPLSGQPKGQEIRTWPPRYKSTRRELERQAEAAIAAMFGLDNAPSGWYQFCPVQWWLDHPQTKALLNALDGDWRSLKSLGIAANTRHLIAPARALQEAGLAETTWASGQSYLLYRLTAQGIEAGTGETREAGLDAKHESPVAKPCAQTPEAQP